MRFTKETLIRALRTFLQAVVAYFATNLALFDFTDTDDAIKRALAGLAASAIAAGIAAVMNLEKIDDGEDE